MQHARLPCPSPSSRACSNSCPSSRWCHPTISSSVVPFSSCLLSFPASGLFPVSQLFASGGQSIGVSASTSVLPMNIQNWFPLGKWLFMLWNNCWSYWRVVTLCFLDQAPHMLGHLENPEEEGAVNACCLQALFHLSRLCHLVSAQPHTGSQKFWGQGYACLRAFVLTVSFPQERLHPLHVWSFTSVLRFSPLYRVLLSPLNLDSPTLCVHIS